MFAPKIKTFLAFISQTLLGTCCSNKAEALWLSVDEPNAIGLKVNQENKSLDKTKTTSSTLKCVQNYFFM
jgi:hypothetical protein